MYFIFSSLNTLATPIDVAKICSYIIEKIHQKEIQLSSQIFYRSKIVLFRRIIEGYMISF